jgi:hypothetical protein
MSTLPRRIAAILVCVLGTPALPTSDRASATPPPNCPGDTYEVRSGDGWFDIATRAGVAPRQLLRANGARATDMLHPGDELCLPNGAATPTPRDTGAIVLSALPVHGPCWYGDTWLAPRGGGRRHQGVDLITAPGNYVYAVVDGTLSRRAWDAPGRLSGNAWWLRGDDGNTYFYAHLSDFAPGLKVGARVRAGEVLGFVGSTGNSSGPHLHFEIHPGGGPAVNPYPVVRAQGGCRTGEGYRQPNGWVPTAREAGG